MSAYGKKPLYLYSTTSYAQKAGLEITGVELDFMSDDKLIMLLEVKMVGGPAFAMGNCFVKSSDPGKKEKCETNTFDGKCISNVYQLETFFAFEVNNHATTLNLTQNKKTVLKRDIFWVVIWNSHQEHEKKLKKFTFDQRKRIKTQQLSNFRMEKKSN